MSGQRPGTTELPGSAPDALADCLSARPVRLAYLFGSRAEGRARPDSDVDIAVLLDNGLTADERYRQRLGLIGDVMRVFATDAVDVVILNDASPLLAFEVLRGGKLLYCPDDRDRVEFQVRTVREYEDTAPLRRILSEALLRDVREGEFGRPSRIGRKGVA